MKYILIISFIVSGILAYFVEKIKLRYSIKLVIEIAASAIMFIMLLLTDIKYTSFFICIMLVGLFILGIVIHFVFPLIINGITYIVVKISKQPFEWASYDTLYKDGYRMYFINLLFLTLKIELIILFIFSLLNLI